MPSDPATTPLTSAQSNALADIAHARRMGQNYYKSPGWGPARVLAKLGYIQGEKSTHPWDNERKWTLTAKGEAVVASFKIDCETGDTA